MNPLLEAIDEENHLQVVWLLNHGTDVNRSEEDGITPLLLAIEKGDDDSLIHQLMHHGADLHVRDRSGKTPLMLALDHGHLGSVGALLAQYAFVWETPEVDAAYEQGRLALLFAIYQNEPTTVLRLLEQGTDSNSRNAQGRTPLMLAVKCGHVDIAALLIDHGADVRARETDQPRSTGLHIAADGSQEGCARLLLEHGAEVDARDSEQETALIRAGFSDEEGIVRLLLEHGADVHAENAYGDSALSRAGWLGSEETIRTLLKWGAASHPGHLRNAFHLAFMDNNEDKIPLFIEAGLTIGLPEALLLEDGDRVKVVLAEGVDQEELNYVLPRVGYYPRMEARTPEQGYLRFLKMLVEHGADVNTQTMADVGTRTMKGRTALMHAAANGQLSIARFLLKHGAQVNLRDENRWTALMFAVAYGHVRMVRLLLKHGATPFERATDGRTALTLSEKWPKKKIYQILWEARGVY